MLSLWWALYGQAAASQAPAVWLDQARQAIGRQAWSRIGTQSYHYTYQHTDDADSGEGSGLIDFSGGRFAARIVFNPVSVYAYGMDGHVAWSEDLDILSVRAAAANRSELYRQSYGYWFAHGRLAKAVLLGQHRYAGRRYQVISVTPRDGQPFDFWINTANQRVERRAERIDGVDTIIDYANFRRVGKVWLPFEERRSRDGAGHAALVRLHHVAVNVPLPPADLATPEPKRIGGFAGPGAALTIPFEDCENHICVPVMLNGAGPFRFVLDTGARNVMASHVFKQLQLTAKGNVMVAGMGPGADQGIATEVGRTSLGGLSLDRQDFVVLSVLDQIGVDGMLGYEWFARCPILIDYAAHRLTLYEPEAFHYTGPAPATPLYFDRRSARVDGVLDGIPGRFGIDTGSYVSLTLSKAFIDQFGLMQKYAAKADGNITILGAGGTTELATAHGSLFQLAGVDVAQPALELSLDARGVVGGANFAGNIGSGLMKQLKILLDYRHRQVYMERNN